MLKYRHRVERRHHHSLQHQAQAAENLHFIRTAMEHSARFTDVPGKGKMLVGATALLAAVIAARQTTPEAWTAVWLAEAAIAAGIGAIATLHKAQDDRAPARGSREEVLPRFSSRSGYRCSSDRSVSA